jgi:radical SAM protein with 4Fe4S-binding SPASM domain
MSEKTIAQQVNIEAAQKNIPLSVFVELTRKCNLDCYYCYQKLYTSKKELSLSKWKKVLKELADIGTLYLTFSGGEPFLRKDFYEILSCARSLDFAVSTITNGLLLQNGWSEKLADLGVMDVGVSFHAAEEEVHDILAGHAGSFKKALNTVKLLVAAGVKVVIKHSVSRMNFGEYKKLQKLAESEGCAFECDSIILPSNVDEVSQYSLGLNQHHTFLKDMDMRPGMFCVKKGDTSILHCDAGRSLCGISPRGEVFPCIILPITLGNLNTTSFKEIWNGETVRQFRFQEENLSDACNECSINYICSRCNAVAYLETSRWTGKSKSLCDRAEAMGKL